MPVERKKDGGLRITLPYAEGVVLSTLPGRLRSLLESESFNQRVVDRLFPRAYDEPEQEEEYRKLLGDDLKARKLQAIEIFEKSLRGWKLRPWGVQVTLRPEEVDLWLGFINDMRLFLGIELDIRDNDWGLSFRPEEAESDDLVLLHFLTWLEQETLDALGFPQPPYLPRDESSDRGEE